MKATVKVQMVFNPRGNVVIGGKILDGTLIPGMKLNLDGQVILVRAIEKKHKYVQQAVYGDSVGIYLEGINPEFLKRYQGLNLSFSDKGKEVNYAQPVQSSQTQFAAGERIIKEGRGYYWGHNNLSLRRYFKSTLTNNALHIKPSILGFIPLKKIAIPLSNITNTEITGKNTIVRIFFFSRLGRGPFLKKLVIYYTENNEQKKVILQFYMGANKIWKNLIDGAKNKQL